MYITFTMLLIQIRTVFNLFISGTTDIKSNGDPFIDSENSKLKHCTPDYRLSSSIL